MYIMYEDEVQRVAGEKKKKEPGNSPSNFPATPTMNRKERRQRKFNAQTPSSSSSSSSSAPSASSAAPSSAPASRGSSKHSGLLHGKRKRDGHKSSSSSFFKGKGKSKSKKPAAPPLTGKAAKRARQLEKPHGNKVVQAKEIWNRLRDRHGAGKDAAQRQALVNDIMALIGGSLWEVVARHDASRVVQACFRYGSAEVRTTIMGALAGKCYELATTQYGHHLLKCILRHGSPATRAQVLKELKGNVARLATHATGASILELIYNGHQGHAIGTKAQIFQLLRECFGRQFLVFSSTTTSQGGPTAQQQQTLGEFLAGAPERRESIMGDLGALLDRIVTKGYHRFSYAHWILAEYFAHCGPARKQAMVPSLIEGTLSLASTKLGAQVLCDCVDSSGAKERKKIVKFFRGNARRIAAHPCGHYVLMRCLDIVDDTVLMRKAVVAELAEHAVDLALDPLGCRVLLQLLAPNTSRYVGETGVALLSKPCATSKKDPQVRREEHLKTLRGPLVAGCVERCHELLATHGGRGVLLEVVRNYHPAELCTRLAELLAGDAPEEEKEQGDGDDDEDVEETAGMSSLYLENIHVQLLAKELIRCEQEADVGTEFTTALWERLADRAEALASGNRTAYVIEALLKGSVVSDTVKAALQGSEATLRAALAAGSSSDADAKTSESIQSVLKRVFPEPVGGKTRKTVRETETSKGKKRKALAKPVDDDDNGQEDKEEEPRPKEATKKTKKQEKMTPVAPEAAAASTRRSTRARQSTTAASKKKAGNDVAVPPRRSARIRKGSL